MKQKKRTGVARLLTRGDVDIDTIIILAIVVGTLVVLAFLVFGGKEGIWEVWRRFLGGKPWLGSP